MRYLLDTNVVSELVARQPSPRVIQWIDSLDPDSVYLSVITIGELRKGIEKLAVSQRKDMLYAWLNDDLLIRFSGRILILDIPVMLAWGELVGRLELQGRPLPSLDSLIAAQAQVHSCALATRNHSDFHATGVNIVNPWN
jgi:toxin FitB